MTADVQPLVSVVLRFGVGRARLPPVADDDDHRVQPGPLGLVRKLFRQFDHMRRAGLDATVAGLGLFRAVVFHPGKVRLDPPLEQLLQVGLQRRLVPLRGEHIIGLVLDDLCGDVLLAPGRVDGDRATLP